MEATETLAPVTDGYGLALTTTAEAAAHYREAVAQLLGAGPHALESFDVATGLDPVFALGHAGAAVVSAFSHDAAGAAGHLSRAVLATPGTTSRERQHVTTLVAAFTRDGPEAVALARRHLTEFSADAVIVHVVALIAAGSGDVVVRAELRDLIVKLLPGWERS